MTKIRIDRFSKAGNQTLGMLDVMDERGIGALYTCRTFELPWKNNERQVSCIPLGVYKGAKYHSPKFGDCIHITGVPGRDGILIHPGNFLSDTHGCILVGDKHMKQADGTFKITNSRVTMAALLKALPETFNVEVV